VDYGNRYRREDEICLAASVSQLHIEDFEDGRLEGAWDVLILRR
jgi:hypothetical protein